LNLYIETVEQVPILRKKYPKEIRTCVADMKLTPEEFQIMIVFYAPQYKIHDFNFQFSIDKRTIL
jgi:hypothetical protein